MLPNYILTKRFTYTDSLNIKEGKTYAISKYKKFEDTVIIADKIDILRDGEGNFIILRGSIIQEDIKMTNMHAP